jgi:hypothetical protein
MTQSSHPALPPQRQSPSPPADESQLSCAEISGRESSGRLEPPQFSLRVLFWMIAGVGAVLAISQAVGPAAGLTMGLGLVAILAHVAGNVIGTKLHSHSPMRSSTSGTETEPSRSTVPPLVMPDQFAPVTRLSSRTPLGRGLLIVTSLGAMFGGIAGGALLLWFHQETATLPTLALGFSASAVLAGLWTYWMGGLLQVFLGAWWEAHHHGASDRRSV